MRAVAVVAAVLIVAALILAWRLMAPAPIAPAPVESSATSMPATSAANSVLPAPATGIDPRLQQIADAVRTKYADRIHQPDWQIKVLSHLMNLLQQLYPETWRDALATVLQLAFPEQAVALWARLEQWLAYERWLEEVFSVMAFADADQRQQTLWDKRRALFGDDAEVIWAAELKQRAFDDNLAQLDKQSGDVTTKADAYVALVRDTFGDTAFGNQGRLTTQLMGQFVKLESVQAQLREMPPAQQDQVLTEFRRDMGRDDEAVERWSELDQERREHRSIGSEYMARRDALINTLEGEAQQDALWQLQVELFGEDEARFLRNEEQSGVYRFEQQQVIGFD